MDREHQAGPELGAGAGPDTAGAAARGEERLRSVAGMSARDELESLALQADTLGTPPQPGDAPPGAPGGPDAAPLESPNVGMIALALTALREASVMMLKVQSPRSTLNDQAIKQCAEVLAPVADKYGINLAMQLGPEVAAAMVAGPILWTFYSQLDLELKARKAKPAEGVTEGPAAADAAPT